MDTLEQTPLTPTTPPANNRGRRPMYAWANLRKYLDNPALTDGNWYAVPLAGLSLGYARRQANRRGFVTAVEKGVLKIRMNSHPAPSA